MAERGEDRGPDETVGRRGERGVLYNKHDFPEQNKQIVPENVEETTDVDYIPAMMIRFHTAALFPIILLLGANVGKSDGYRTFLALGDQYYARFDNMRAYEEYVRAHALAPVEFETLVRMVRIHNDIGRLMLRRNDSAEVWYEKAVEYAELLLDRYPDRAESHFWVALAQGSLVPFRSVSEKLDIGKFVIRHAQRAIELDSTFAPPYVLLGILYREAARLKWYERFVANVVFGGSLPGTIEDSRRVLERAVALDSTDIFARVELARTHRFLGNQETARELFRNAMALTPRSEREVNEQRMAERFLAGRTRYQ